MSDELQRIACASREEWLKKRHEIGFGASEAAAFFGHGWKGRGALSVVMEKVLPLEITPSTEKQEIALALEASIRKLYGDRTGRSHCYTPGFELWRRGPVFATPDCLTLEGGPEAPFTRLVQYKTDARTPDAWSAGIPLAYQIQAQQEMYACDLPREDFAVLFYGEGDLAFRVYECEANPEFQRILVAKETAAWDVVLARRRGEPAELPPPCADDVEAVNALCKPKPTIVHQFDAADSDAVREWLATREHRLPYTKVVGAIEELERAQKHRILVKMNGAEIGELDDGRKVTVKEREREVSARQDKWLELALQKERKPKTKEIEAGE